MLTFQYPYFKFLREPTTESFKLFRSNFCSPEDPDGAEKLSVFLGKIMIRRTHMDKLFDAKLLNLPQPEQCIMRLDFNQVERAIYAMVEARYIAKVNQMSQDEELSSQYSHIWTMATRLRQICGHMSLAQGTIMDLMEREDYEKLESLARNEKNISKDCASLLEHLRHRLHVKSLSGSTDERQIDAHLGDAVITEMETAPIHLQSTEGMPQTKDRGQHGDTYHIGRYLDEYRTTASFAEAVERAVCQYCHQRPFDPHVTSCHHIYCFDCLTDMQHKAAARGAESSTCLACGQDYSEVNRCEESMYEPRAAHQSNADSQEGLEFGPGGVKNTKKKVLKVQTWLNMNGEVLPSAKTLAVKVQIEHWKKVDKDVKIIVYTQFLDMVQILKRICSTEGWETCRYTGDMSHDAREKVIAEFGSPGTSKKILLASLRCGGLGLNLTMASRVITLDPWWNASVEQQAFCRVFRIGQLKETQMTRLVVKDTIDEKIMRMQESKQKAIDEVMEDRNGKEKLSIQELMQLFGDVGKKDGKAFIFAQGRDKGETAGESGKCVDPTEEDEDGHLGEEE